MEETQGVLPDPDLPARVSASRAESDMSVTLDRNEAFAMPDTAGITVSSTTIREHRGDVLIIVIEHRADVYRRR